MRKFHIGMSSLNEFEDIVRDLRFAVEHARNSGQITTRDTDRLARLQQIGVALFKTDAWKELRDGLDRR